MPVARYLSHPQVVIAPHVPVPKWGLNAIGAARVAALATSGTLNGTNAIYCSTETKAVETASPLADAIGCPLHQVAAMGENDRSATGFLAGPEFEATADQFFANPDQSITGWETAANAQRRIVSAVKAALDQHATGDVLFVGHGAVGTLLYCALADIPINRNHDQPTGGGNMFCFDIAPLGPPHTSWRPMETLLK